MPVYKCSGINKWRIGNGPCIYKTKKSAVKAYQAYLAKHPEEKEESEQGVEKEKEDK